MTSAVVDELLIVEPGVYDLSAERYHADPVGFHSLSSSGARTMLDCPAKYHYNRDHPKAPSKAFDLGHAAHRLALGAGMDVVVVDADDWRTKAARELKDESHAAGLVPVLAHEWAQVREMHAALKAHPYAGKLFTGGKPEQTLVWVDEATGVWCRAMLDYLRPPWIVDYKTAESVAPADLRRTVANYGYDVQAWWYVDGLRALGLAEQPAFVFVAQEKTPPYLVTVFQLDDAFMARGEARARHARERFRDCTMAGVWPGYAADVVTLSPPPYLRNLPEEF